MGRPFSPQRRRLQVEACAVRDPDVEGAKGAWVDGVLGMGAGVGGGRAG